MTTEQTNSLVLRDPEGNLYRLSREVLDACRVSEEEQASLEDTLSDDTGGFADSSEGLDRWVETSPGSGKYYNLGPVSWSVLLMFPNANDLQPGMRRKPSDFFS